MALNQTTGICDYERVEILLEVDSLRLSVHVEGECAPSINTWLGRNA